MQFIFFCIYSYKLFYLLFINYDYIDLRDQLFMNISKEKLLNMNHHPSMMLNLHLLSLMLKPHHLSLMSRLQVPKFILERSKESTLERMVLLH